MIIRPFLLFQPTTIAVAILRLLSINLFCTWTFLVLLFLSSPFAFAQSTIVAREEFTDNVRGWVLEKDSDKETSLGNGRLLMEKKSTGGHYAKNTFSLDPDLPFYIETKIKVFPGRKGMFSLHLNDARKSKNLQWKYFIVLVDGSFIICENSTEKLDYTYLKTGKVSPQLLKEENTLAIEKKGTNTHFYINSQLVSTLSNLPFWGNYIGIGIFDSTKVEVDYLLIKQDNPINLADDTGLKYSKERLNTAVNTPYDELMPMISPDGNTMFITVCRDPKNTGDIVLADVWSATWSEKGEWNQRQNLGAPINTSGTDFLVNVSPDNNSLLVYGEYIPENGQYRKGFGLSKSHKTKDGWSIPEKVNVPNFYTDAEGTSFSLSPDNKVLLSSIEQKDSYGTNDLYASFLQKDGSWSEPRNMGPDINTYGNDQTPFIAADGKTLYYSTNGKPGYGNNDIFVTRRLDDTWTRWSAPQNLGPQINTANWDAYFSMPASGEYAYLVSNDIPASRSDISRIKIAQPSQPEPVVILYGNTYDKTTKQPIEAAITYHDLTIGKELGIARSNAVDGSYKLVLPYSKAYGLLAQKTGFLSESNHIDLKEKKPYQEIHLDLYLARLAIGEVIALNNVFFVKSKPELLAESFPELERLTKILADNPNIHIALAGHTDNQGDAVLNLELSEKRAAAIKDYLVSHGTAASRISGKGFGGSKPIASNSREETRKLNRRVEFSIVK
jgi:outer membrane protein OmpA-like peptidoglycan-associated protein